MEETIVCGNGQVVDAGEAKAHEAVLVKLPIFIAIGAEPVAALVVVLVGKADSDAVLIEGPKLLDEPIVEFALPLTREKRHDLLAALEELGAIAPAAVGRIGERYGV